MSTLKEKEFNRLKDNTLEMYSVIKNNWNLDKVLDIFNSKETDELSKIIDLKCNAIRETEEFKRIVKEIIVYHKEKNARCAKYAGVVQAVFEMLGIKSNIVVGIAFKEDVNMLNKLDSIKKLVNYNHVWVEAENRKIYEKFDGINGKIYHICGEKVEGFKQCL